MFLQRLERTVPFRSSLLTIVESRFDLMVCFVLLSSRSLLIGVCSWIRLRLVDGELRLARPH